MKERYLKNLERRLVLKYTFIVLALSLGGATILYIFDNVLNGIVIDFLKVLLIDSDPFSTFKKIFAIVLPAIIAITGFMLVYFLCRELSNYLRVLMEGMDDVLEKQREKLNFPKELQPTQKLILSIAEDYQRNEKAALEDEEKKKDLIYLLAQDIKLPLSNILMYLELLEKEQRISPQLRKEFMVSVLYKSMDLEEMINEFFDITRFNLRYAKWTPEHMYLDRMVEQVLDEYYQMLEEKSMKVDVQYEHQLPLYADNDKIARVLRDLLRNMIALGDANSTIVIQLMEHSAHYTIVMKGSVPHLSAYQIAHIFHNYYRLEDLHGSGKQHVLGLGIAKQIVDMHKGILRASSLQDTLQFYIDLPKETLEKEVAHA